VSVRQAENVVAYIQKLSLPMNGPWPGGLAVVDGQTSRPIELRGGMKLTLLSPRGQEMERLASFWEKSLHASPESGDTDTDDSSPRAQETEAAESQGSFRPKGTPAEGPIDVDALAAGSFSADRSVFNNASIAFLAEHHGKSLLVCGDASADVLAESIQGLIRPRRVRRLRVDAMVVPHGGSSHNLHRQLLELLDCDRYLFATSGERHRHPDRETIARILAFGRTDRGTPLTLVFNYRAPTTAVWDDQELQRRWNYRAIYPGHEGGGIKVQI